KVDAVTVESARAAGRALVERGRPAIAALGPGNGLESTAEIAESWVRRAAEPPPRPAGTAMAFFRSVSFSELLPAVTGKGVYLRPPAATDYSESAELREHSREFLPPWEPVCSARAL